MAILHTQQDRKNKLIIQRAKDRTETLYGERGVGKALIDLNGNQDWILAF